jgi:hypothetical protein
MVNCCLTACELLISYTALTFTPSADPITDEEADRQLDVQFLLEKNMQLY